MRKLLVLLFFLALPATAQARLYNPTSDGQCLTLQQARDAWPTAHLYYRPKADKTRCWHAPKQQVVQQIRKAAPHLLAKPVRFIDPVKPLPPGLSDEDFNTWRTICGTECALQLDFKERWRQLNGK